METLQALHLVDFLLDAASVRTLSNLLAQAFRSFARPYHYHKISDDEAIHISQLSNLRMLGISFRELELCATWGIEHIPIVEVPLRPGR
jgi:hypothetical protein